MTRTIRILTANLLGDRADPVAFAEIVEALEVDVACVQELGPRLAKAVGRVLPEGALEPNDWNRGMGIATRHPVEVTQFPLPKRDGWAAKLTPARWRALHTPIEIVNLHVMGPHTWPYFPREHTRRGQLIGLLDYLDRDPQLPRAVLGDFNSSPIWPFYRRVAARLTDASVAAHGGEGRCRTWPHWPSVGTAGLLQIDHCFVSKLRALSVKAVKVPGSDHLALCVDLELEDAE